jgi:hypothetical protein
MAASPSPRPPVDLAQRKMRRIAPRLWVHRGPRGDLVLWAVGPGRIVRRYHLSPSRDVPAPEGP